MLAHDVAAILPGLRAEAEAMMVDACTIVDPALASTQGAFDPDTGTYGTTPADGVVYQGRCKVKVTTVDATEVDAAGQRRVVQRHELHLPVADSTTVKSGHVATVDTATNDPALQDRRFRVVGLHHETNATARRLEVVEV